MFFFGCDTNKNWFLPFKDLGCLEHLKEFGENVKFQMYIQHLKAFIQEFLAFLVSSQQPQICLDPIFTILWQIFESSTDKQVWAL